MLRPGLQPVAASLAVVFCAAAMLMAYAAPAAAHANLLRVAPGDGDTVDTAPTTVTLTFDEEMRAPAVVLVTAADGSRVNNGRTVVVNNTTTTRVLVTEPGRYTVAYRVVSADGHPVTGQTTFGFRAAAGASGSNTPASVAHAQHPKESGGLSDTRIAGSVAGAAAVVGVGLLIWRRRAPDLRVSTKART
jgi:methionine-rich copper-binding protein CopC